MAFSLIAHVEASLGVNGGTTGAIDTTGASFLVASVAWYSLGTGPTVTDSKSNTWSSLTTYSAAGIANRLWYCIPSSVGSGHTFTGTGSGSYSSMQVLAFSGQAVSPFDVENGATVGSTTIQPGSITPSEDNELVVVGLAHENNGGSAVSIDGGFTAYKSAYSGGTSEGGGIAYLIQTTAAAANPTWNIGSSAVMAATIACFKAAAGASPKSNPPFTNRTWRRWPRRR